MIYKSSLLLFLLFIGCARAPLTTTENSMRLSAQPIELTDTLSLESLREAFRKNLAAFSESSAVTDPLLFGAKQISKTDYKLALQDAEKHLNSWEDFLPYIRENFDVYENYGQKEWGDVFSTGYYEPKLKGSRKKNAVHSQAIYDVPKDMVSIDLNAFAEKNPELSSFLTNFTEQKSKNPQWRGRLVRGDGIPRIVPFYDRKEIDQELKIQNQNLELAWVDPVDAFFLQIQGSGTVEFSNGKKIRVGYAAQNGYSYTPIGKFLLDKIPLEKMSMQKIREHMSSLTEMERQELMNKNESYVFFRPITTEPLGLMGAELTASRSIATDKNFFPKGVLCFMQIEIPVFTDENAQEEVAWSASPRFVFDQDTGGAIRGGGRADLFTGSGVLAEQAAGVMKRWGNLYYLVPKDEFLMRLKNIKAEQ